MTNKLYALSVALIFSVSLIAQNEVFFVNQVVEPELLENAPFDINTIDDAEIFDGFVYRLVQFSEMPSTQERKQMEASGLTLLEYIPNRAYVAKISRNLSSSHLDAMGIRAVDEIRSVNKMSKSIASGDIGDWALTGNIVEVRLVIWPEINPNYAVRELLNAGAAILQVHENENLVYATIDLNKIYDLPKLATIAFVDIAPEPGQPEDREGRSLHRSNLINTDAPIGNKFDGTGISVQTRDDGLVGPHIDYHGRLTNLTKSGLAGTIEHGDMVSGIFAGAGNLNPLAKGMASGADLFVTRYQADFLDNTMDLHRDNGVLVTNSSYSNGCNAGYTAITRTVDNQIENNPTLLHVFSAGNSGSLNCQYGAGQFWGNITGGHKIGKNVIATANLRIDVSLEASSSRGPAADGRLKPDLAARGTDQLSTDPNNGYSPGGGTSAASPGVAGVSAQLIHAYKELNNGDLPESALIKAVLMNTANDLGNVGPDFLFGYGHLNAYRAYKVLEEKSYLRSVIDQGMVGNHQFSIGPDAKEMRVMLYWREPAGTVLSRRHLVNDLDLIIRTPSGEELRPWLLDPTPDPQRLSLPATNGRDSLNNAEQIVINDREEGVYEIEVHGTEIPFGEREYYLIFTEITDEIKVTYPNGGEGFVPRETEQIHWDAIPGTSSFELEYSTDGGASWNFMGMASGSQNAYSWNVPEEISSECLVRVSRNGVSGQSEGHFSIVGVPQRLRVRRVCPDVMTLDWAAVEGALGYDIYKLGERHMEVIGSSDTNYIELAIENALDDFWLAVGSNFGNDQRGRRSIAINYNSGLLQCSANSDAGIVKVVSPHANLLYSCGSFDEPVMVLVKNTAGQIISDLTVTYQLDNELPVAETFNVNLDPGDSEIITFSENLMIADEGDHNFRLWIDYPEDEISGNNEVEFGFTLIENTISSADLEFTEDFESANFPPIDWRVEDEEPDTGWINRTVIGPNGTSTTVMSLNNSSTFALGTYDNIITSAINLEGATQPVLSYDFAYYESTQNQVSRVPYRPTLNILIYEYCGSSRSVTNIYEVSGRQWATVPLSANASGEPTSADHWDRIALDLSSFVGSEIRVAFNVSMGFRFNIFIDNINIEDSNIPFPSADYSISNLTPCSVRDNVVFEVLDTVPNVQYMFLFGQNAIPPSAEGKGPHNVKYFADGPKNLRLVLRDTLTDAYASKDSMLHVYRLPVARFNWDSIGLDVSFSNLTTNAESFEWDFGDGNMSSDRDPTHTYSEKGSYTVTLRAIGICSTVVVSRTIDLGTVSTRNNLDFDISILPNPTVGNGVLHIAGFHSGVSSFVVKDLNGRNLYQGEISKDGDYIIPSAEWNQGLYFIEVIYAGKKGVLKLIKG